MKTQGLGRECWTMPLSIITNMVAFNFYKVSKQNTYFVNTILNWNNNYLPYIFSHRT